MDLNSEGSSPPFPIIYHSPYAYLISNINIAFKGKKRISVIICTKKVLRLLRALRKEGCLSYLLLGCRNSHRRRLVFSLYYYKQATFFKQIQLLSTISKKFTISLKALTILNRSLKQTVLLIETSSGIINHKEALKRRTGGLMLCLIS